MSRNSDVVNRGYPSGLEGHGRFYRDFWNTDNLGKKGKNKPMKALFFEKS